MTRNYTTILFAVLIFATTCSGQSPSGDSLNQGSTAYLFSLYPMATFAHGLKVEVERRVDSNHFAFGLSPEVYYGTIEGAKDNLFLRSNKDTISVSGYGAEVVGKYYLNNRLRISKNNDPTTNFYVLTTISFRRTALGYTTKSWVKYQDNGTDYYTLQTVAQNNSVTSFGGTLGIGSVFTFGQYLFVDVFLAYRAEKSSQTRDFAENIPFTDNYFTRREISFVIGGKIGLLLR